MKWMVYILFLGSVTACTTEQARRSTYETLENIRMQRCAGSMSEDCQREGYYDYNRKRDEAVR